MSGLYHTVFLAGTKVDFFNSALMVLSEPCPAGRTVLVAETSMYLLAQEFTPA
jgi:hypothetical protein